MSYSNQEQPEDCWSSPDYNTSLISRISGVAYKYKAKQQQQKATVAETSEDN